MLHGQKNIKLYKVMSR